MRHRPPALLLACLAAAACSPQPGPPQPSVSSAPAAAPAFVDERRCAGCHAGEAAAWTGSHHDLAMQEATAATVLGDFDDAAATLAGVQSRFQRDGDGFALITDGADGASERFEITHCFGVAPLQQYLVDFPGGRKQATRLAWDADRSAWFTLYGEERIPAGDALHWTQRAQNWNWQCAGCHATNLKRGWDASLGEYRTTAHRFDVGCQACHGPGSAHANDPGAVPTPGMRTEGQVETCARCHSRRAPIGDGHEHGRRLMDDYLPAVLSEGLYHADGQILDEVYVWGSFAQSKMHAKGVRCSDCHDPHSATTKASGNATCTVCHSPGGAGAGEHVDTAGLQRKHYDSPAHHFHEAGGPGSACVDCHAPARTYMEIDARRDHSFRIPRPDLSAGLGTPDACTGCHADQTSEWAAARVSEWYGEDRELPVHPGETVHAAREGRPGAAASLLALLADETAPPIWRATALELLPRYPSAQAVAQAGAALDDADPLVRHAAILALDGLAPERSAVLLEPLLRDPVRGVRLAAAERLAGLRPDAPALQEWVTSHRERGDQPEALLALARLAEQQGRREEALALVGDALSLDESFAGSWLNLADLHSRTGDEAEAEAALREGLQRAPAAPLLRHALGLSLVRQGRHAEALPQLARAARDSPEDARLGFVLAIALRDAGRPERARAELERVLTAAPWARDARYTLAGWLAEEGRESELRALLDEQRAINPFDPALQAR